MLVVDVAPGSGNAGQPGAIWANHGSPGGISENLGGDPQLAEASCAALGPPRATATYLHKPRATSGNWTRTNLSTAARIWRGLDPDYQERSPPVHKARTTASMKVCRRDMMYPNAAWVVTVLKPSGHCAGQSKPDPESRK